MALSSKFKREGTVSHLMCHDWFKRVVTAILLVVMSPCISHKLEACKNVKLDWDGHFVTGPCIVSQTIYWCLFIFLQVMSILRRWWDLRVKNSWTSGSLSDPGTRRVKCSGSADLDFDHNGQLMNFNGHSLVTTSRALPVWGIINQITRLSKLFLSKMFPSSFLQGATSSVGRRSLGWQLFVGWLFLTAGMGKLCKKSLGDCSA